jgi:prevent-host-death family protein
MAEVTIRELRNNGGDVIDRVLGGERLVVTRSGRPVAELRPLTRRAPEPATLLDRWRHIPHVDPEALRRDIDRIIDPSL